MIKKALYLILSTVLVGTVLIFAVFAGSELVSGIQNAPQVQVLREFFSDLKARGSDFVLLKHEAPHSPPDEALPPPDLSFLPEFCFPELLREVPAESSQFVVALFSGAEGNLFLVERSGETFYLRAGPLYCRAGGQKASGAVDPLPLPRGVFPTGGLRAGDTLALDLLGSSRASGLLLRAETEGSDGDAASLFLSEPDFIRLMGLFDEEKHPASVLLDAPPSYAIEQGMPSNFLYLSDAVPGAFEDPAYAGDFNFMGRPLDGYVGKRVVVSAPMANALNRAVSLLSERGLSILVYDAYRPTRAVRDVFAWIQEKDDLKMKEEFYPALEKKKLPNLYLVQNSRHSYGGAVDLTLCDRETGAALDMGTHFDFFSSLSHYDSREITPEQRENRALLRGVMREAGLFPYDSEWWHFNLSSRDLKIAHDFVIAQ